MMTTELITAKAETLEALVKSLRDARARNEILSADDATRYVEIWASAVREMVSTPVKPDSTTPHPRTR